MIELLLFQEVPRSNFLKDSVKSPSEENVQTFFL